MPPRTLILDLDGTLCLGEAPVRRVAHHAFSGAPEPDAVWSRLERFLSGEHELVAEARDGYDAVAFLALGQGVDAHALNAAFLRARSEWELWLPEVSAPPALRQALSELRGVRRVLATNSPAAGIPEILAALGLAPVLDEVVTDAGKPTGMPGLLDRLGVAPQVTASQLAGIGDRWRNDLEEIHERGGTTFQIDGGWGGGPATAAAAHPDLLAEALLAWAG